MKFRLDLDDVCGTCIYLWDESYFYVEGENSREIFEGAKAKRIVQSTSYDLSASLPSNQSLISIRER